MKKKSAPVPEHRMGNSCGYTLHPDGSIEPAPTYVEEFQRLANEQRGIDSVLRSVTAHCQEMSKRVAFQQDSLWNKIRDDYGMDYILFELQYDFGSRRITKRARQKKKRNKS
jgi:hypothetical protein